MEGVGSFIAPYSHFFLAIEMSARNPEELQTLSCGPYSLDQGGLGVIRAVIQPQDQLIVQSGVVSPVDLSTNKLSFLLLPTHM